MNSVSALILVSVIPVVLLCTTAFVKISTVLEIARNAMGANGIPSSSVVFALSVALTLLAMAPVIDRISERAANDPATQQGDDTAKLGALLSVAKEPVRAFLKANTASNEVQRFAAVAAKTSRSNVPQDDSFAVLAPAFVVSELTRAFVMGVALLLPFLVIDLIVANVLSALGTTNLNATHVSLPMKLLLFVSVDGWGLLGQSLVSSYVAG